MAPMPGWPLGSCRPQTTGQHRRNKGALQTPKPPRRYRWAPELRGCWNPQILRERRMRSPSALRIVPRVDFKGSQGARDAVPQRPSPGEPHGNTLQR